MARAHCKGFNGQLVNDEVLMWVSARHVSSMDSEMKYLAVASGVVLVLEPWFCCLAVP